jgi:hypothetical protein
LRSLVVALFLTLAAAAGLAGQDVPRTLEPGTRIRVTSPGYAGTAVLVGVRADTLHVTTPDGGLAVPADALVLLERSGGRPSTGRWFLRGAAAGAAGSLVGGVLVTALFCDGCSARDYAEGGFIVGGVILAPIFVPATALAFAIWAAAQPERWHPVPLASAARLSLAPDGSWRLGLSFTVPSF